jgi:nitrogen fixation NifU-like protein
MYSERLLDHFRNPRNAGALGEPAVTVEVSNPACGDLMRLSARMEEGRITAIGYQVRGCTASIGCGSALTELAKGRTLAAMEALTAQEVEEAVGGLIPESRHAAALCRDAARALAQALRTSQ